MSSIFTSSHVLGLTAVGALALAACASNSGVVPVGKDTYMVSRQAATGFSGVGPLRSDALREAGQYCTSHGKYLQVEDVSESSPPYILGNFPRAEVHFMCLDAGDPALHRPTLTSSTIGTSGSSGGSTAGPATAPAAAQALQQFSRAIQDAPLMPYKQKCLGFGFTEGTPEFAQCVLRQYNAAQPAQPVGADLQPPLQCQTTNNGGVTQTNCVGAGFGGGQPPLQCQTVNNGGVVNTVCH